MIESWRPASVVPPGLQLFQVLLGFTPNGALLRQGEHRFAVVIGSYFRFEFFDVRRRS